MDLNGARARLDAATAVFVDIRDPQSFAEGHIPGARRLDNANIQAFLDETPREQPIIVCCYHGNSSRQATAFLLDQGFANVWSLRGGFESWRLSQPSETGEA
ncbi:MAG: thiosulfate sulfurtransferase GlpE [Planctomycetes bacterium]|nr:thiosulfate sulfurtransferase GlpE [Planctomycetota bacterium]